MRAGLITVAALALAACGGGDKKAPPKDAAPPLPEVAIPAVGVAAAKDLNYLYGDGAKAYKRAVEAYKKKDWAAVKAACEEAIAKDAGHLDAHRVLATALAQLGEHEAATKHLVTALAGDFLRWGPKLPEDAELADYFATPHGKALLAAHLELKAEVEKAIARGVPVLARRSTFKYPSKSGSASSRGELYAWDAEARRMIRLTHTDHTLVAWLPSPSGDEIALIGLDRAVLPKDRDKEPPLIRAWVETVDARTWEPRSKRARFDKVRAVSAYFGPGGQLLVDTFQAQGRWGLVPVATYSIDPSTGKAVKTKGAIDPGSGRARVSLDEAVVTGAPVGLTLTPAAQDPGLVSEITFASTSRTISLPLTGVGDGSVPRANPAASRVAFATWADPCANDDAGKPTLFAADAKTGALEHILTADSRFHVRWLDDDRLAYEDGSGGLRIWDATTRREVTKLAERAGLALYALSPSPKPICRREPLEEVETDDGSEDDLPPEEDPADAVGPVTSPT